MTTTMEIYPQTTNYYGHNCMEIENLILIKKEMGNDQYYKNINKANYHKTNDLGWFGFARLCYLYKTEYKSYVNKLEKKMDTAMRLGRRSEFRKIGTKLEALCHSIEARHNRMTRQTVLAEFGDEMDEDDLALCHQAIKNYGDYEKGIRFAINGNGAKTDKYIKKMNENLTDLWFILTDKNEKGEDFYTTDTDGTMLKNGGAFQPILDNLAEDIKFLKKWREVLC